MLNYPLIYKPQSSFGLDIGKHSAKFLELKRSGKHLVVQGFGQTDIAEGMIIEGVIAEPETLATFIRRALNQPEYGHIKAKAVTTGLPQAHIFTRTISLPAMKSEKMAEAVQWEAQQYIPMPMSDLYLDFEIVSTAADTAGKVAQHEIFMVAAPRAIIDSYIKLFEFLRLMPESFETTLAANTRALHPPADAEHISIIFDAGAGATDIAVVNRHVIVSTTLAIGGDLLRDRLAQQLSISEEHALELITKFGVAKSGLQQKILSALKPELDKIVQEIKKLMKYYDERSKTSKKLPIEKILMTGSASHMPGFAEVISSATRLKVETSTPWDHHPVQQKTPLPAATTAAFTTAFGLALRNISESHN